MILRLTNTSICISGAICCSAQLDGVRLKDTITYETLSYISIAGGMQISIDGLGLASSPSNNTVMFKLETKNLIDTADKFELTGPSMSADDSLLSTPAFGKLSYTLPALEDLYKGTLLDYAEHYPNYGVEDPEFEIFIAQDSYAVNITCALDSLCNVRYSLGYTPIVHDISPSEQYAGQVITAHINPMGANLDTVLTEKMDPIIHFKQNGFRIERQGLQKKTLRLSENKVGTLHGKAPPQKPGKSIPDVKFLVGDSIVMDASKHCNFAGDDCWTVKTHSTIDSISSHIGYSTGGQDISIKGNFLKATNKDEIEVLVDNIPCFVNENTQGFINCSTTYAAGRSVAGDQPAQPGLIQYTFRQTDDGKEPDVSNLEQSVHDNLLTSFETSYNSEQQYASLSKGWFKAPASGQYRFLISCSNTCRLSFDDSSLEESATEAKDKEEESATEAKDKEKESTEENQESAEKVTPLTIVANRNTSSEWRNYFMSVKSGSDDKFKSDWIFLEKDAYHKIEGYHYHADSETEGHFTVSVEYQASNTANHQHTLREIQVLSIDPKNTKEKFEIKIKNANGGSYRMQILNPLYDPQQPSAQQQLWASQEIKDNCSATELETKLSPYFLQVWGSDISVQRVEQDDFITYAITVKKQIGLQSFSMAFVIRETNLTAQVEISSPYQISSQALQGSFIISCRDENQIDIQTSEIKFDQSADLINLKLQQQIPHLQLKVLVKEANFYDYKENGVSLAIIFLDFKGDAPECSILSGVVDPIQGSDPIFRSQIQQEFGKNLLFEPIPLEMLFTNSNLPQVRVKVDGSEALCINFNCDYAYVEVTSFLTEQTYDNETFEVSVIGQNLPIQDDFKIQFAGYDCADYLVVNSQQITCRTDVQPAAGVQYAKLMTSKGLIPVASSMKAIVLPLIIKELSILSNISKTSLNQAGGDIITFTGKGFDEVFDYTLVLFGDGTTCQPISSTFETLSCEVNGFNTTRINAGRSQADIVSDAVILTSVTVYVNGVKDRALEVEILPRMMRAISVTQSISPVDAGTISIALTTPYIGQKIASYFTVTMNNLYYPDEPSLDLTVSGIDELSGNILIRYFGGATSGKYGFTIRAQDVGRIESSDISLIVWSRITGINPRQGSALGGTILYIDGENFSSDADKHIVKVGDSTCNIILSSDKQIQCRIEENAITRFYDAEVTVQVGKSEFALSKVSRTFTFQNPISTITDLTSSFNEKTQYHEITVTGTDFPLNLSSVYLLIDGVQMETLELTYTEALFNVTTMLSYDSQDVRMVTEDGFPLGYLDFTSVTLNATLLSISNQAGSAAGTFLTVKGSGFGLNTPNLGLYFQVVTDLGEQVITTYNPTCKEVTPIGYGEFTCLTSELEVAQGFEMLIGFGPNGSLSYHVCNNTIDPTLCTYAQEAISTPKITGNVLFSNKQIKFTGTGFPIGYNGKATFRGIESDLSINFSQTSFYANFENGVPVTSWYSDAVTLQFSKIGSPAYRLAYQSDTNLTNTYSVTDSSKELVCSFFGGCSYVIESNGLTSMLYKNETNKILACGQVAQIDSALSNDTHAVVTLPKIQTRYSVAIYEIPIDQDNIHEGVWTSSSTAEELAKLIDGDLQADFINDPLLDNCFYQIQYEEEVLGYMDRFAYFINKPELDRSIYEDRSFKLSGSNDGFKFTTLWNIDTNVNEGWNYHVFPDSQKPSYNIYRFEGGAPKACRLGELLMTGVIFINDISNYYDCEPELIFDNTTTTLNYFTSDASLTPKLIGISEQYGPMDGGQTLTFSVTSFDYNQTTVVLIDGVQCVIQQEQMAEDSIVCITGFKVPSSDPPTISIHVNGTGYIRADEFQYLYTMKWSDPATWNQVTPLEGDDALIPAGTHVVFDQDSSQVFDTVTVEGSLIFLPNEDENHERSFKANQIFVNGGYLEIGTVDKPYTSKLSITLQSRDSLVGVEMFGKNVIGILNGVAEVHGVQRVLPWLELKFSTLPGEIDIVLDLDITDSSSGNSLPLNWQEGEQIVISSTDFEGTHSEVRTIKIVSNANINPILTLDKPLEYAHYSEDIEIDLETTVKIKSEVAILSRNIKIQGDSLTSQQSLNGGIFMVHSTGGLESIARLDSVEFNHAGQAFKEYRYPIHFHMISNAEKSYIKNCVINQSFSRAIGLSGVKNLLVQNNVIYGTAGHGIFTGYGAEQDNLITKNLVIDTKISWALQESDLNPASFYLTSPRNIITDNRAAGSDNSGFMFDLAENSVGPIFSLDICPVGAKLNIFEGNMAHSNKYGMRINGSYSPRTYECQALEYDSSKSFPYELNQPLTAEFNSLTTFKNSVAGVLADKIGAVHLKDFIVYDNAEVGIEVQEIDIADEYAQIYGGLFVGQTNSSNETILYQGSSIGIISPRTENFTIELSTFKNYNWNDAAALGTCSQCKHIESEDSGARTVTVTNLQFDPTSVTKRIRYGYPYNAIFYDTTGGLTYLGKSSWAIPYFEHNAWPECTVDRDEFDGITCPDSVQVRRVELRGMGDKFADTKLKIIQFSELDEYDMLANGTLTKYLNNQVKYSEISQTSDESWAVPFVTNNRYRLFWDNNLEIDTLSIIMSERWIGEDWAVLLNTNQTEVREQLVVQSIQNDQTYEIVTNGTLLTNQGQQYSGDYVLYDDPLKQQLELVVNGAAQDRQELLIENFECAGGSCVQLILLEEKPLESTQRLWSNPESWNILDENGNIAEIGSIPKEGDEVEIQSGWNMVLDLEETPILKSLTINGQLSFVQDGSNVHLKSKQIFVRAGNFTIGEPSKPFDANAQISLYGDRQSSETLYIGGVARAGNKVFAITGKVEFYGKQRSRIARLLEPVSKGKRVLKVGTELDWKIGDRIYIAPTASQPSHSEYRTIENYLGGQILLDKELEHYHYGDISSPELYYNGLDIRGEVVQLSRNILINGEDESGWGAQIFVTDFLEADGVWRKGKLIMTGVEVIKCSQVGTSNAAIRFEGATQGSSSLTNVVVRDSYAWALSVFNSENVQVAESDFIGAISIGVRVDYSSDSSFTKIFVADVKSSNSKTTNSTTLQREACVAYCSYENNISGTPCPRVSMTDSIVTACPFAGYIAPGHNCGQRDSQKFSYNVAHSVDGMGAYLYADPTESSQQKCMETSFFFSYKNQGSCMTTYAETEELRVHDTICVDNVEGLSLMTGGNDKDEAVIFFYDSSFYGESLSKDCPDTSDAEECFCADKTAMMLVSTYNDTKPLMPTDTSDLPIYRPNGIANWIHDIKLLSLNFIGFDESRTECGAQQKIFARNPYSQLKTPKHYIIDPIFQSVNDDAIIYLEGLTDSELESNSSGSQNILLTFSNVIYSGDVTPIGLYKDFQIISNVETIGGTIESCELKNTWNAYQCVSESIGLLMFEILSESDVASNLEIDQNQWPISVTNQWLGFNNTVNAMKIGSLSGSEQPRFPIVLDTEEDYTLSLANGSPQKQRTLRFSLDIAFGGTKIRIPYDSVRSIQLYANGQVVEPTSWFDAASQPALLTKAQGCGEHRFVDNGAEIFLEFYITESCEVDIVEIETVMNSIRLDWSLAGFYTANGVAQFETDLAFALSISTDQIRTTSVREGSVVVGFYIQPESILTPTQKVQRVTNLRSQLVLKVNNNQITLGAPILGLFNSKGKLSAQPGGLNVGIDGNIWDILQAAEEKTFIEETLPTGDEISTEKDTGAAEVSVPNVQTILIRKEVIVQDKIIIREIPREEVEEEIIVVEEEEEMIEKVEKTSIWFILGPTIVTCLIVIAAIFFVVCKIRNERPKTQKEIDSAIMRVSEERAVTEKQYELNLTEGQRLVGGLKNWKVKFDHGVYEEKYIQNKPQQSGVDIQEIAMPLRKKYASIRIGSKPAMIAGKKKKQPKQPKTTVVAKPAITASGKSKNSDSSDKKESEQDSELNLNLSGYQSHSTPMLSSSDQNDISQAEPLDQSEDESMSPPDIDSEQAKSIKSSSKSHKQPITLGEEKEITLMGNENAAIGNGSEQESEDLL